MSNKKSQVNTIAAIRWMIRYIRPYNRWFYLSMISIVFMAALNILKVYYLKLLVDDAASLHFDGIGKSAIAIVVIAGGGMAASFISKYSSGKYGIYAVRDMKAHVVSHISSLSIAEIEDKHSSRLISLLQNEVQIVGDFIVEQIPSTISLIAMATAAVYFMLSASYKLALLSFILIPISVYIVGNLSREIKMNSSKKLDQIQKSNSIILDTLNGIEIVKAYGIEAEFANKYEKTLKTGVELDIRSTKLATGMLAAMITIFNLPYVVCIVAGGYLALKGQILIGTLVAFMQLLEYIIDPLLMYKDIIASIRRASSAIERIKDVLDINPESKNGKQLIDNGCEEIIKFEDVCLSYDGNKQVLSNLTFAVHRGEKVAIVGGSGAGKSTIFNLLCGFYKSNYGSIKLFGKNINDYSLVDLRSCISLVAQNVYLFPGTIKENILSGKACAGEAELIEAAKAANAHEFILSTENGYETEVGENGTRFSGGQRQKISIARGLLKDAPILLLDEATSALDNNSEYMVQEALKDYAKNRTVLVIAHKLSTVKTADRILVLDKGRIVEEGTHEELLKGNTKYKQLYYKQFLTEAEGIKEGV